MSTPTVETVLGDWQKLPHSGVTSALTEEIAKNLQTILEANTVLLASESSGTGKREIDKALKAYDGDDSELSKAIAAMNKAQEAAKKAVEKARNLYRTNVLNEEEQQDEPDVDLDELKTLRKSILDSLNLIVTFAKGNGQSDLVKWAQEVKVPQVGRQGTSGVAQSKPRGRVSVAGEIYESFGEAATALSKQLSNDEVTVSVKSPDLAQAWMESGGEFDKPFTFKNTEIVVSEKKNK